MLRQPQVAIATTTFYKDPHGTDAVRYHLACQTIGDALQQGHAVFVADGSPDDATLRSGSLANHASIFKEEGGGMGASRRQVFSAVHEAASFVSSPVPWVLWMEPEKTDMIRHIPAMVAHAEAEGLDILVPTRNPRLMEETYPAFQVTSEREANAVFAEVTGRNLDIFAGPILFRTELLDRFATCNPKERYGAERDEYNQMPPVMEAIAEGLKVGSLQIDFCYPASQCHQEETSALGDMLEHRRGQLGRLTGMFRIIAKALGLPKASA